MASKVNVYHFSFYVRDILGDSVPVGHYRVVKASLPQAVAAFRKYFSELREPTVNYTMDCKVGGKQVWEYVLLAES